MKRKLLTVLTASFLFVFTLTGCNMINSPSNVNFDNKNITPVKGQEGYYVDESLVFCAEIRGSYKSNRPFTLDLTNENLRVWDNVYLYEYDYFQMIVHNSPNIFYSVNSEDLEYVTIEDKFAQATVKEGKSGIYKITFDLSSRLFDLEYKSEISTPVYEKMDGCDIYSLKSGFTSLIPNPNDSEEWMITDYPVETGALISFFNHGKVHLSNYKVILDESVQGKYATALEDGDKHLNFAIGGTYNFYVNPINYRVRVELTNPDTADYTLQVYKNGEPVALKAVDATVPYLFRYEVSVKRNQSIPILVSADYVMYDLTAIESEYLDSDKRFQMAGTYSLEIDLKSFTVSATYLPQ